jgi:hypothetical protein
MNIFVTTLDNRSPLSLVPSGVAIPHSFSHKPGPPAVTIVTKRWFAKRPALAGDNLLETIFRRDSADPVPIDSAAPSKSPRMIRVGNSSLTVTAH